MYRRVRPIYQTQWISTEPTSGTRGRTPTVTAARIASVTFADLVGELSPRPKQLTLLNRTAPVPVLRLLKRAFDGVAAEVTATATPRDVLLLNDGDEPLGASRLAAVSDTLLLVNSDTCTSRARADWTRWRRRRWWRASTTPRFASPATPPTRNRHSCS